MQFKNWRKDIPDYEKRLYDRVKKINRRTVSIQRYVIIGAAALLIFIPGLVFLIIRLLGTTGGTTVLPHVSSPDAAEKKADRKVEKQKIAFYKKVLRQQATIRKR